MFTKLLILGLSIVSTQAFAISFRGGEADLQFSKGHRHIASGIKADRLTVVREEVRFPAGSQFSKLDLAIEMIEEIVNSEEFKEKVITYQRSKDNRSYSKNYLWNQSNSPLSNEEIYSILMKGNEKMRPETLGEMNLNIRKYQSPWYSWSGKNVIGWTSPGSSKWIRVNWRFYDDFNADDMVGNLVHEWIHLLGFLHGKEAPKKEVPYVVGYIAKEMARAMLEKNDYSSLIPSTY